MNSETHCPFCKKPFTPEEIEENRRAEEQFLDEITQEEVGTTQWVDGFIDRLHQRRTRQLRRGA